MLKKHVINVFKCQNKPLKYPSNNIYKYQKNPISISKDQSVKRGLYWEFYSTVALTVSVSVLSGLAGGGVDGPKFYQ